MRAEIVSIGTELLLGELVDTNAAYMARQLASIGLDLHFKTTVGDNRGRIAEVLRLALSRCDVVITSGGLGPTVDDVTREAVADATGRALVRSPELLAFIAALFARWGRQMTENNSRQAYIPEGAMVIENPVGTAPAFAVETPDSKVIISLPGVPREMEHLMTTRVIPYLKERLGNAGEIIKSLILRTCAIGESQIDELIGDLMASRNPTVGTAAHAGQTDVRITVKAESEEAADRLIAEMERQIRARLGDTIYGTGKDILDEVVVRLLQTSGQRLAILETNTGGKVAARLREVAGGDGVLAAAEVYPQFEGVPGLPEGLGQEPWKALAASEAVAQALRQRTGADLALAFIGSMGSGEDLYAARTGVTQAALTTASGVAQSAYNWGGTGDLAARWVGTRALDVVRRHLLGVPQL
jgi:nicotinamide-nucleotide amidase